MKKLEDFCGWFKKKHLSKTAKESEQLAEVKLRD